MLREKFLVFNLSNNTSYFKTNLEKPTASSFILIVNILEGYRTNEQ